MSAQDQDGYVVEVDTDVSFDLWRVTRAADRALEIRQQMIGMMDDEYTSSGHAASYIINKVCEAEPLTPTEKVAVFGAVHYFGCRLLQAEIDNEEPTSPAAVIN